MTDTSVTLGIDSRPATQGAQEFVRSIDRTRTAAVEGERSVNRLGSSLKYLQVAFAAVVGSQILRQWIQLSDTASRLSGQLNLVSRSQEDAARTSNILFESAQRNRSSFESTVELYARLQRSANGLGIGQKEIIGLTDTITQSFIVSGTGAGEAANGVRQLAQAFASGVLRGDEFNSVMENAPRLAQAIADGLKVPIGRLREMAEAGKLTASEVSRALISQRDTIQREFNQMPTTIAQSFQQLENVVLKSVGRMNEGTNAAKSFAEAVQGFTAWLQKPETIAAFDSFFGYLISSIKNTAKELQVLANIFSAIAGGIERMSSMPTGRGIAELQVGHPAIENPNNGRRTTITQGQQRTISDMIGLPDRTSEQNLEGDLNAIAAPFVRARENVRLLTKEYDKSVEAASKFKVAQDQLKDALDRGIITQARYNDLLARAREETIDNPSLLTDAQRKAKQEAEQAARQAATTLENFRHQQSGLQLEIQGQEALIAAYRQGPEAVAQYANELEVLNKVAGLSKDLTNGQVSALEDLFRAQQRNTQTIANQRQLTQLGNQAETAQTQLGVLGMPTQERERRLATLQLEQSLRERGLTLASAQGKAELELTMRRLDANQALQEQSMYYSFIENAGTQAFQRIGEAITQAMATGKMEWKDLGNVANAVLSEIIQMMIQLSVINPLKNAISGGNDNPTMSGLFDFLTTLGSAAIGSQFGPTTTSTGAAFSTSYNGSVPIGIGRASGGGVWPGTIYPVGERGVEMFSPSTYGHISPHGAPANSNGGTIVQIIDQRGSGAPVKQERQRNGDGTETLRLWIRDQIVDTINKGEIDNAMKTNYSVRRQGSSA